MSSNLPQSPLTADIPNAAYPTPGQGLVLGTNGLMDPTTLGGGTRTGLKFLRDDQTWQTAGSTTYRKTTSKTVNGTTTETDLLNGEITVAANAMGASGMLRGSLNLDILQGALTPNWRFRIKLGATTIFDTGASFAPSTSATRQFLNIDFRIANLGATNSQSSWFRVEIPSALPNALTTPATLGLTNAPPSILLATAVTTSAVDTTAANVLAVSTQHSGTSASQETKLWYALIEVV